MSSAESIPLPEEAGRADTAEVLFESNKAGAKPIEVAVPADKVDEIAKRVNKGASC